MIPIWTASISCEVFCKISSTFGTFYIQSVFQTVFTQMFITNINKRLMQDFLYKQIVLLVIKVSMHFCCCQITVIDIIYFQWYWMTSKINHQLQALSNVIFVQLWTIWRHFRVLHNLHSAVDFFIVIILLKCDRPVLHIPACAYFFDSWMLFSHKVPVCENLSLHYVL